MDVVEDADKRAQQQLDFKLQDAEALGQVLVILQGAADSVWQQMTEEALIIGSVREVQGEPRVCSLGVSMVR